MNFLGGPSQRPPETFTLVDQFYPYTLVFWAHAGRAMALFCSYVAPPVKLAMPYLQVRLRVDQAHPIPVPTCAQDMASHPACQLWLMTLVLWTEDKV